LPGAVVLAAYALLVPAAGHLGLPSGAALSTTGLVAIATAAVSPTAPRTTSYRLWTPWLIPARILAVLPMATIAARTRDIRIGLITHVLLNTVDLFVLLHVMLSHSAN
jgi:hypothetical protein